MADAIHALRDCEYKLSCLIERFAFEEDLRGNPDWDEGPCDFEELCGHWACEECGCLKDARDRARDALEAEGGAWNR